jgi:hypothetical protein
MYGVTSIHLVFLVSTAAVEVSRRGKEGKQGKIILKIEVFLTGYL